MEDLLTNPFIEIQLRNITRSLLPIPTATTRALWQIRRLLVEVQVRLCIDNEHTYRQVSTPHSLHSCAHTFESSLPKILLILPNLTSTRNASNIQRHILRDMIRERLSRQDITDRHSSAGLQQSSDLLENGRFVSSRDEVNDAVTDDAVDARVRQRN